MASYRPGQVARLRSSLAATEIEVVSPSGERESLDKTAANDFIYTKTNVLGVYNINEGRERKNTQRFSVNLFDAVESNIVPRDAIETEYDKVQAEVGFETTRREGYRWLLLLAFFVLLFEWYIYNRRVYI